MTCAISREGAVKIYAQVVILAWITRRMVVPRAEIGKSGTEIYCSPEDK